MSSPDYLTIFWFCEVSEYKLLVGKISDFGFFFGYPNTHHLHQLKTLRTVKITVLIANLFWTLDVKTSFFEMHFFFQFAFAKNLNSSFIDAIKVAPKTLALKTLKLTVSLKNHSLSPFFLLWICSSFFLENIFSSHCEKATHQKLMSISIFSSVLGVTPLLYSRYLTYRTLNNVGTLTREGTFVE